METDFIKVENTMNVKYDLSVKALKNVMQLIEDGDLVRNTKKDNDIMIFMAQGMKITNTLKKALEILKGE